MTTYQFFITTWEWNPTPLLLCALVLMGYFLAFGLRGRPLYLAVALIVFLVALMSPLSALADGYLFSAHMVLAHPFIGWIAGVGAMWLWHAPTLCNAATTLKAVSVIQTISLLLMGSVFWWQVLAPRDSERLSPPAGIVYLFTACTACSVLGIILTFAPVSICPAYQQPVDRLGILKVIRGPWGLTSERDQQIGGLLMWVPMCLIYLTAILAQLARWQSDSAANPEKSHA